MIKQHDVYIPLYTDTAHPVILVTGGRGCEHPDTPIMMADLTIRPIKDIKVGESVMGDDGTPRLVLDRIEGTGKLYKVKQKNAEDYIVNDTHILSLKKTPSCMLPYGETKSGALGHPNGRYPKYGEYSDIPIEEFLSKSRRFKSNFKGYKSKSIPYEERGVLIEPYLLGLWLGDGTAMAPRITNADEEIKAWLEDYCERSGLRLHCAYKKGAYHMGIVSDGKIGGNSFLNHLKEYNLIGNKHIPQEYISNSERVRLELLAGLLDTDAHYDKLGDYTITQKSEAIVRQIKFIADTLGFRTKLSSKNAKIGGKDCGVYYSVTISGNINRIPCRVERKKGGEHYTQRSWLVSTLDIEEYGYGEWVGIMVDGNNRYLHADGTVTHNSGKSHGVSTFITDLTFEYNKEYQKAHNILFTRYTMVSAGISIIPEVTDKIVTDGLESYFKPTKTDILNKMTGSRIMFRGIHTSSGNQTAKLKSISGVTTFVCDEAEEWTSYDEFEKIFLSMRQKGLQIRAIIIMNPTDTNHWVYEKYIKDSHKLVDYDGVQVQISTHPDVLHIHTTYLDNEEYLSDTFLSKLRTMKLEDPARYAHVAMGRWDDVAEGAIFKKWGIVEEFPAHAKKVARAIDFGYTNDPTAIVRCGIVDNMLYIDELCYKTHMTSADLIKELREEEERGDGGFVYADSADPRLIDEIGLGGVIIYPVQKGAGSIMAGISKMLSMQIFVTKRSVNIQNELRNYVYAKDKDGNYINEPEDHDNHGIDASRYYTLAVLLGKIMKPKKITKADLGVM